MKKPLIGILVVFPALLGTNIGREWTGPEAQQEQTQLRHEVKVALKLIQVYVTD